MRIFVVDAFAEKRFQGNQAGVVLLDGETWPEESFIRALAAELKHSETVFVQKIQDNTFKLRYFTPVEEVELCGHATVSAFCVLRDLGEIGCGSFIADTLAGALVILVYPDKVWMDMAPARLMRSFAPAEAAEMYAAFGLEAWEGEPKLISTGLADILLPVPDVDSLNTAKMDRDKVIELSCRYDAVGFHLFTVGTENAPHRCRNFGPRVGIDEECATGTANGGLTYYLQLLGRTGPGQENRILQGEAMGRPSVIWTRIKGDGTIQVGGNAVISLRCTME